MSVSRTLIRATGVRGDNPSNCIAYSNRLLAAESLDCMFVTVFYGILDVNTGEVNYCNAGHNPPYILKSNGQVEALPMSQDPMVGAIDGIEYHESSVQLAKGDALVMFTDGVTEAMDSECREFGEERLESTLATVTSYSCQQIIEAVRADVATFVGEAEQSDDITVLALKRI